MLIDSNIIIYAAQPEHTALRALIAEHAPAVKLRQLRKMTLGDALIAGTALTHQLTLVTRNTADFAWIAGLKLLNPFEQPAVPPDHE